MLAAHPSPTVQQHRPAGALAPLPEPPIRWLDGLILRQRRDEDAAGLASLLGHADFQRNGATLDLASPADVAAFLGSFPPGSFEVVGLMKDAVVAYGGIYPLPGRQKHTGALTLCVHHAHQRRGFGTALLFCMVNTARAMMGLGRLQLTVFVDNARAIALYRRFGFVTEGRLSGFVERQDGSFIDAYLMALIDAKRSVKGRIDAA